MSLFEIVNLNTEHGGFDELHNVQQSATPQPLQVREHNIRYEVASYGHIGRLMFTRGSTALHFVRPSWTVCRTRTKTDARGTTTWRVTEPPSTGTRTLWGTCANTVTLGTCRRAAAGGHNDCFKCASERAVTQQLQAGICELSEVCPWDESRRMFLAYSYGSYVNVDLQKYF